MIWKHIQSAPTDGAAFIGFNKYKQRIYAPCKWYQDGWYYWCELTLRWHKAVFQPTHWVSIPTSTEGD